MAYTAGLMALWLVAATPAGAIFDADARLNQVQSAVDRNELSVSGEQSGGEWRAPLPPPRSLPHDPAYEGAGLAQAPAPGEEGIPGLPPVEEKPQPLKPLPPMPPKKIEDRGEAVVSDEGAGRAFCGDEGECGPCAGAFRVPAAQPTWFDNLYWEGWLDQGLTINTLSPRNRINGPVTFNDRSNDYQLNQLYSRLGRDVDANGCFWDIGGRVDLLYGSDSIYVDARGLEVREDLSPKWNAQRDGLAMPQCYMEVYSPWGHGLSVKMGHFYSILGYESAEAPQNFFYSHSYLRQYSEPFTHTGLLAETRLGGFTVLAGMTRGDDNWEDNNNDLGVTGGVKWEGFRKRTKIALCVDAAREQPDPSTNVRSVYSLVIQQKLGRNWECVLQHDYGSEPGAGIDRSTANWYGLDTYLFYAINDAWKAGLRFEWFRDEGGARIPGAMQTADYFELSPGINWKPSERLLVRSELRWDWTGTPGYYPFGDGTRSNQLLWDFDVIVRF